MLGKTGICTYFVVLTPLSPAFSGLSPIVTQNAPSTHIEERATDYGAYWIQNTKLRYAQKLSDRALQAHQQGQIDLAREFAEAGTHLHPNNPDLLFIRAQLLTDQNQEKPSIQLAYRAHLLAPDRVDILQFLGKSFLDLGISHQAVQFYQQAYALLQDDPILATDYGYALTVENDYDAAVRLFNRAITLQPDLAPAYINLGIAYARLNQAANAAKAFEKAITLDPANSKALNNLGGILIANQQYQQAAPYIIRALELSPSQPDALRNHLAVISGMFKLQDVHQQLLQYKEQSPNITPYDLYVYGMEQKKEGQLRMAVIAFCEALRLDLSLSTAKNVLAEVLAGKNEFELALPLFRSIPSTDSVYEIAQKNIAAIEPAVFQTRQQNTLKQLSAAIIASPGDAAAYHRLGLFLLGAGQAAEAAKHLATAVKLDEQNPDFRIAYSTALSLSGNEQAAIQQCRKALQLRWDDPQIMNNLAWLFLTKSDAGDYETKTALLLAIKANELTGMEIPEYLRTLAKAYAGTANPAVAMETAQKAITLAEKTNNDVLVKLIQEDLEGY